MKPTGGGPTVTPIAPPAPLFPGITGAFSGTGGTGLGTTGVATLQNIMNGQNLSSLFKSIQDANQNQVNIDTANLKESFGSSGMGMSTDMMSAITNYQTQNQKQLTAQFGQLGLENESMQLGGLNTLMQLATAFAPTQVVGQAPSGQSIFSQVSSAGESAMMLYLLSGAMAACWIAESFYGKSWKTWFLRVWLHKLSPKWFRKFYLRYGQRIAVSPVRWLFRPVFEFVLWRHLWLNTVE